MTPKPGGKQFLQVSKAFTYFITSRNSCVKLYREKKYLAPKPGLKDFVPSGFKV